jgi:hypothetical protein
MSLGYSTASINGQLVPVAEAQAFSPLTFGAQYSGPGYWPRGGQWNVPPLLPSASASAGVANYAPGNISEGGGYTADGQPAPTSSARRSNGSINWFHPTKSPVIWAFALLGLSLFLLHKVHYAK